LQIKQWHITEDSRPSLNLENIPDLSLVFGSRKLLDDPSIRKYLYTQLKRNYVSVSTAGEIIGDTVSDDSLVITSIHFRSSKAAFARTNIKAHSSSFDAGESLVGQLDEVGLTHILIFSDGTRVNGTELVEGMNHGIKKKVPITGGLAGDQELFRKTLVGLNRNIHTGNIVAIGLYGQKIRIEHGSQGGWDSFGPDRLVTRSEANVLYELDDKPALDLYKRYLGSLAEKLPGSGLLFPLSIRPEGDQQSVVRTILSVNEKDRSMTFAGNIPQGRYVRLMKANFDRLIDAAGDAAQQSFHPKKSDTGLALLISCVGRRLALNQRVDEELEAVIEVLGHNTMTTGFYSYGEISPQVKGQSCELLNQTMTITTISENE
jgi:hypothetical protein